MCIKKSKYKTTKGYIDAALMQAKRNEKFLIFINEKKDVKAYFRIKLKTL